MAFIVKDKGSDFVNAPDGTYAAVCIDVVDMGIMTDKISGKDSHKCKLVWAIDETMEDGRPFIVNKLYTASLNEKANLTKDLERWRAQPFTKEEREGFDVEKVIGHQCMVQTVTNEKGYSNVSAVMAKPKNMAPAPMPKDYVRVKDRVASAPGSAEPFAPTDNSQIPF